MVGLKQNPILSLFSLAPCGSMWVAEQLNKARKRDDLVVKCSGPLGWVVPLA